MTTVGVFAHIRSEEGNVLLVRQAYGDRLWALPGGLMESGEDPAGALLREVMEETGFEIAAGPLIGTYAAPYKDDLVLFFEATIRARRAWRPDGEITDRGFHSPAALPEPMGANARLRIADAAAGCRGILRVLTAPGIVGHTVSGWTPQPSAAMATE
jgi:ADP-ribose pyrophosphatase/8-oxo-dGTP diphosphatase